MSRRLLFALVLLVLGVACGLQFVVVQYFTYDTTTGQSANRLMQRTLEGSVAGWQAAEQPLGPTEAANGDVQRILNFDDCVSRTYTRGTDSFSIFVAYWSPNKMPTNLVASHTPDRCWVSAGWVCDAYDLKEKLQVGVFRLQPAFWRLFYIQGRKQHVLYWHLVGGRAQIYGGNTMNSVTAWRYWWKEAASYGLHGNEEQYFVRVTSDRPFEEIWREAGFQDVMGRLAALGLAAR